MTAHRALRFVHAELSPPVNVAFRRTFETLAPGRTWNDAAGDSLDSETHQIPGAALPGDGMERSYTLRIGGTITVETDHGLDFTTSPLIFKIHASEEVIDAVEVALVEAAVSAGFRRVA